MVNPHPGHILQNLYRKLLNAMSMPGVCHDVSWDHHQDPGALLMLTAQCLIDHETTYHLIGEHPPGRAQSIETATGAVDAGLTRADFVFIDGDCSRGLADRANRGTLTYPDQGATLIYHLPSAAPAALKGDLLTSVRLTGPGIRTQVSPPAAGLDYGELALLRDINAEYPLGVDTLVIWGNDHMMAIPRSTRIEVN